MKRQNGFAHIVVIIGLVIAILGALGFIFWQNYMAKEQPTTGQAINTAGKNSDESTDRQSSLLVVDKDDYMFIVADGFKESSKRMYTYTASMRSIDTYIDADGNYFEILVGDGPGGGYSADFFWRYVTKDSNKLSVEKSDRCEEGDFACTADNGSIEGIISSKDKSKDYYFAFGNKAKDDINLEYVDEFISSFEFK